MDEIELDVEEIEVEPTGAPEDDEERLLRAAAQAETDEETRKVVEAALFSAGGPVDEADIAEATGLDRDDIRAALEDLVTRYGNGSTALEVARAGEKYAMQIRADLTETTRRMAPMEIPQHLLRTLALIAYHQPIKQSDLVDMIGSKTYEHVRELEEIGMIDAEPDGLTKRLTTTSTFPEYFGIDATEPDEIRAWMAEKVGIGGAGDHRADAEGPEALDGDGDPPRPDEPGQGAGVLGALLG